MPLSEGDARRFLAALDVEGDDRRAPTLMERPTRRANFERGWSDRDVRRYSPAALARLTWRTLGHRARAEFAGVGSAEVFEVFRAVFDQDGPLPPRRGPRARLAGQRPVFLLYTAADRDLAVRLHGALRKGGMLPWCDAIDLLPGESWDEGIAEVIDCSLLVLVLITARWPAPGRGRASHYEPEELARAIDHAQRAKRAAAVVPVRFDGVGREHLPYGLYRTVPIIADSQALTPLVDEVRRVLAEAGGELDATTPIQMKTHPQDLRFLLRETREILTRLEEEGADAARIEDVRRRARALEERVSAAERRNAEETTVPRAQAPDETDTLPESTREAGAVVDLQSICRPAMVYIPAGELWMGAPADEEGRRNNEVPRHRVSLTRGFAMATTPITVAQFWQACGRWSGDDLTGNLPMTGLPWEFAMNFCNALSTLEGLPPAYVDGQCRVTGGYRLPTEAEWEHACRAGTVTRYWSGDDEADLARVGWYRGNSLGGLRPVGGRPANPWGLYDMHGNCREWCGDWYGPYPRGPVVDPTGPASGRARVVRGGSARSTARGARSASRAATQPEVSSGSVGFRVVRDVP
ncbi:MAG: SUMF1/EgtB/PvdO family nonheme iron enzyme [bacterium]